MKKLLSAMIAAAMLLTLGACAAETETEESSTSNESSVAEESSEEETSGEEEETTEESDEEQSVPDSVILDREGNEFIVPETVESIISMAPATTETLINLGLADKIIAIDTYSVGLEGLSEDIPTFDMMTPDTETIAQLEPDLVIATGMSQTGSEDPYGPLEDLGVTVTYIPTAESIDEILQDIEFLGIVTDTGERAMEIITEFNETLDMYESVDTKGLNVYFEVSPAPYTTTAGGNTYISELITHFGSNNIFADQESWVTVTDEAILEKNPDIIFTTVNFMENPEEEIMARPGWDALTAVKNGDVYFINPYTTNPNEFVVKTLEEMSDIIAEMD